MKTTDTKCGFCHLGTEVESICGKLHHDMKTAAHHKCMQYSSTLAQYKFKHFGGFKIDKVEKEIRRGKQLPCSICKGNKDRKGKWSGATSGCEIPNCKKTFHFYCAKLDDVAITKRLKKASGEIMYSEEHCEQFERKYEDQHQPFLNNYSDEEAENDEEDHIHTSRKPMDVEEEEDEDILYIGDVSPGHNSNNGKSTKRKSGNAGKMSANKNKIKKGGELDNCSPEKMLSIQTERNKSRPSRVLQNNQEEDDESSEVSYVESEASCDESDFECPSDSSISDLENVSNMTSRKLNVKRGRQPLNRSKTRNCDLAIEEPGKITMRHMEKSTEKKRIGSVETAGMGTKTRQETEKQQESRGSRISNRISMSTKNAMLKSKDNGTTHDKPGYVTAEIHVASPPLTARKKVIEDDDTSSGQAYSSDNEITMETDGSTTGSVLQQKNSPTSPNHLPEMSSESEWEEMAQFPACAVAIGSTAKVWPSKRNMIIQRAKEGFDVNHVEIWTTTNSFSDEITDEYLPHIMRIIRDLVREKNFKKLGRLLTDVSCQQSHVKHNKYIDDLPSKMVENIGKSILKKIDREEINGEEVLFMDTKLSTLFLKLNDTVDRVCKIRNTLLPHAKEFLGHLFEWNESTASSAPLSQSDAEMEWKAINNWMTHQQWNLSESSIYPSDDIFLAAKKNQGIEELMMHQTPIGTNKRKVIFVRAMKEIVNYNMFIQELIHSCWESDETLIICHSAPIITRQSLLPVGLPKETQVHVMSAFKPSNKQGISILVIHICDQKQQRLTTGPSHLSRSAVPCGDAISVDLEDIMSVQNRKRKVAADNSTTSPQKQKRTR